MFDEFIIISFKETEPDYWESLEDTVSKVSDEIKCVCVCACVPEMKQMELCCCDVIVYSRVTWTSMLQVLHFFILGELFGYVFGIL